MSSRPTEAEGRCAEVHGIDARALEWIRQHDEFAEAIPDRIRSSPWPEVERAFRDFLRNAASEASGLLINGDLFDVWLAMRHFVVRDHVRVLAEIADVVDAGVPVYFVGGNHDALEL